MRTSRTDCYTPRPFRPVVFARSTYSKRTHHTRRTPRPRDLNRLLPSLPAVRTSCTDCHTPWPFRPVVSPGKYLSVVPPLASVKRNQEGASLPHSQAGAPRSTGLASCDPVAPFTRAPPRRARATRGESLARVTGTDSCRVCPEWADTERSRAQYLPRLLPSPSAIDSDHCGLALGPRRPEHDRLSPNSEEV